VAGVTRMGWVGPLPRHSCNTAAAVAGVQNACKLALCGRGFGQESKGQPAQRSVDSVGGRKMLRQQFASLLDAVNDAIGEFRLFEVTGHGLCQLPPEFFATLRMNRFIADDGKFMGARGDENQDAIAMGRPVEAQPHKLRLGNRHGVVHVFGADADVDPAGGLVLGAVDGRYDGVVLQMLGKCLGMHRLPASSGATAAKTAAAAGKSASTASESAPA
jgi:hypothetical protein